MRSLTRDKVISIDENGNDLVGCYFADEDGSEELFHCSPELADKIIALWNTQDNHYTVMLDPSAFAAVYTEIQTALEEEKDEDKRHTSGLQRAFKALQAADKKHVCVDETE